VFFWSVDTDDFNGSCDEGPFPLMMEANNVKNTLNYPTSRT